MTEHMLAERTRTNAEVEYPSGVPGAERPPLTEGQRQVLEILERRLDGHWTIYVTPFLNGLNPDFVALDQRRGIVLIKVDDRDLGPQFEYRPMGDDASDVWAWYDGRRSRWVALPGDDPVADVRSMEREALDLYLPSLPDERRFTAVLTTVVVFTGRSGRAAVTSERLDELFGRYRAKHTSGRRRHQVLTSLDALRDRPWPGFDGPPTDVMSEEVAHDLTAWLAPSRVRRENRTALPADARQRGIIRRPLPMEQAGTGGRQIARLRLRGPAGSGKSLVVAARAAELAFRGRSVLVLGFNHTLTPILHEMSLRWHPTRHAFHATEEPQFLNLFTWCRRVVTAREPWRWRAHWDVLGDSVDGGKALEQQMRDMMPMVAEVLEKQPLGEEEKFDAVLVDEAQDFSLEAWTLLAEKVVRPGGEAFLVADHTQDIYGRGAWTDGAIAGAGFSGPWAELRASYRLPANLRDEVVRFIDAFITNPEKVVPLAPEEEALQLDECIMRWVQVDPRGIVARAGHEVDMLLRRVRRPDDPPVPMAWSDVVVLAATKATGTEIVRHLESQGVDVAHTFAGRRSKAGFRMGDPRPKVTTIHSFKGAEARSVLVILETKDPTLAYSALTRVRRGVGHAHLTVICSQPTFAEYGAGWPEHTELPQGVPSRG